MTRDNNVGNTFDGFKGASFVTNIYRIDDVIATNGDSRAVFVFLVGFEFAENLGADEFFVAANRDILAMYDVEGIGDFNMLL